MHTPLVSELLVCIFIVMDQVCPYMAHAPSEEFHIADLPVCQCMAPRNAVVGASLFFGPWCCSWHRPPALVKIVTHADPNVGTAIGVIACVCYMLVLETCRIAWVYTQACGFWHAAQSGLLVGACLRAWVYTYAHAHARPLVVAVIARPWGAHVLHATSTPDLAMIRNTLPTCIIDTLPSHGEYGRVINIPSWLSHS